MLASSNLQHQPFLALASRLRADGRSDKEITQELNGQLQEKFKNTKDSAVPPLITILEVQHHLRLAEMTATGEPVERKVEASQPSLPQPLLDFAPSLLPSTSQAPPTPGVSPSASDVTATAAGGVQPKRGPALTAGPRPKPGASQPGGGSPSMGPSMGRAGK